MASKKADLISKGRFRTLHIGQRISVKDFIEKNKLKFQKGRGFYQLTKPETIQLNKEIVIRRKSDGVFVSGDKVRELLEIPSGSSKKFKLEQHKIEDFDVFVQSTSYNRVLLPDTEFLYDTEEGDAKPLESEEKTAEEEGKKRLATKGMTKRSKRGTDETKEAETELPKKKPKAAEGSEINSDVKEIVFSFDTTGSMYPCLTQVRRDVEKTVKRLYSEIPGIKIGVFAHGDYQDKRETYDTKWVDLTTDKNSICSFIKNVESTCGYDSDECYELVLRQVGTEISWTPGSQRALVMIGDANPHGPSYNLNTQKINWKEEAKKLYEEMNVKIYAVQCLNYGHSDNFYRELARISCGWHLKLDQFSNITDFLTAICYREQGQEKLQSFEEEITTRSGGKLNRNLHQLFDTLSGRTATSTYKPTSSDAGLVPVNPSRFQVLAVDERCDIKSFVQHNGLIFKTGKGFYEFTKPETVSAKKEVVLQDKVSGDFFTGPEACTLIGAGGSSKIKPDSLLDWRVFVQSTSYNRVLMPGTGFLFEVDTDH